MSMFIRLLTIAFVMVAVSLEASAKDKKFKPWKKNECRWMNALSHETCENRPFVSAQVQCEGYAYATTGYCRAEKANSPKECLDDDSGVTKKCFRQTRAFSDRMKEAGKKTTRANTRLACRWSEESYLPANDIYVSDLSAQTGHIRQECLNQDFVFRWASCAVGPESIPQMLFCRIADASNDPKKCIEEERDQLVASCREDLEPILARERYNRMGGGTQPSGARQ